MIRPNISMLLWTIILLSPFTIKCQESKWNRRDTCLSYLQQYSIYWKKDTLGKNGARKLMADYFLKECVFTGRKWSDIFKFLGKPNVTIAKKNGRIYMYRINYQSLDIKEVGTILLHIEVDSGGIITNFSIAANDG